MRPYNHPFNVLGLKNSNSKNKHNNHIATIGDTQYRKGLVFEKIHREEAGGRILATLGHQEAGTLGPDPFGRVQP
jgi:hypothetical protein